ncbi:MAG TPA: sugar ABC transporter ATP-binding protein [Clostridiales bacterium]|nr:sugar ABC transporter ATP-binding protein [Clostridiales bacterium]
MDYEGKKPIIEMKNIVKTFPGVVALNNMTIDLYEGEIHCIVGENGAGKSTLMKILAGAYTPDSGEIFIDNKVYKGMTAALSRDLGINIIYQENLLVPAMNVVENIFVGQEISKGGFVDKAQMFKRARELCESLGIELNLNQTIENLSVSEQQFVKILKALSTNPRILIMDEPTSMFNVEDANRVLNLVKRVASNGVSILYISHYLKEIVQIADRITVIRDGMPINTYYNPDKNIDLDIIVRDMVGRPVDMFYEKESHDIGDVIFQVEKLKLDKDSPEVSFDVRKGEILGIAGMVGSGRTEIANAIVGACKKYSGTIKYKGKELNINKPSDSIRYGIAYITEDRQRLGLMLEANIIENLTIVGFHTKIKGFFVNVKKHFVLVSDIINNLKIKMASPFQAVKNLSGGNQQKVVLGKWLFSDSSLFIFDEPTRGIDVNAKAEFYKIMSNLTKEGKSIILISSDMPELISMSDRIAVLRKGRIVKILEKDEISENSIIRYALEVKEDVSDQKVG